MREGGGGSGFRGFGSTGEQGNTFGRGFGTAVGGPGGGVWGRGGGSSSSDASVGFGKDNSSAKLSANSGFGSSQSTWHNKSAGSDISSGGVGGGNRPSGFKRISAEFSKTSGTGFGKAVSNGGVGGNVSTFGFGSSSLRGDGNSTVQLTSGIPTTTSGEFGAASFSDRGGKSDNTTSSSQRGGGGFGSFGVTPQATATKDFGPAFTQIKQGGFGGTEPSSSIADDVNNESALKGFATTASSTNVRGGGFGMASTASKGFTSAAGSDQGGGGGGTSGRQPTFGNMGSSNRFGAHKTFGTVIGHNSIAQQSSIAPPGHSFGAATGALISGNSKKYDYPPVSLRGDESDKRIATSINDMLPPPPPPVVHKNDLELNKPRPHSTRIMGITTSEAEAMKAAIQRTPRAGFLGSGGGGNGSDCKSKMYEKMTNSQEQSKDNNSKGVVGEGADGLAPTPAPIASEEGVSTIDGVQVEWERRDFADAVALIGRNELMCSSKEVDERIRMDDLRMLEREHVNHRKPDGTPYRTHEMAIKKFKRVTPGTRKDDPAEVRTPKALEMTMSYLEDKVIPKGSSYVWRGKENDPRIEDSVARMKWGEESASDEVEYEVYKYVWDRTREIRGDYSMQGFQMAVGRLDSVMDLNVYERIARWHICMDHRLHGNVAYDRSNNAAQNLEQLKATLGSLLELYCVVRSKISAGGNPKDFTSPHEAELCAYHLLLNLDQDGGSMALSLVQEWIDNAPEVAHSIWVKRALKVLVARKNGNFSFFFRELSTAPYLFRCCLFMYVSSERSQALRCLQATRTYPLDDLIDLLAFQSRDEAIDFVTAHGLEVDINSDVSWFSSKGDRMLVTPARLPVVLKMEATIEPASRGFGIKDIIYGKALPKDRTWGRALSPHGQNLSSAIDSQNHEERAMLARVIEVIEQNEEDRQKNRDDVTRLVELERIKMRADAERKTRETEERAKKALQDAEEKRRLKALRLQEEEKERLLMLERQAKEKRDAEAKYLLKQKQLAEEKAEREARLLSEEKLLAEKAEKIRQEEERRQKELEEKGIKEAEERRRREEEERLRKAEERRREAEHRARIAAENSRRLKLATAFCSQRILSFAMSTWHARAEETTNLWRLEFARRKRNRDAIASTDISLIGQPLLKQVLAFGDLIVCQRSVAAQPQPQQFAAPLGHHKFCRRDEGEINDSNVVVPSPPHLKTISPELSALAIAHSLPSSTPSEQAQLFRILVIHSESAPSWLTKWLEGCLGIRGGHKKHKNGVVAGEVMCALSSGGGRVCICARSISMQYNDEKATTSSLVEQHSAVASAAVFALSVLDSVLPKPVESLSRAMNTLPKGIPVALLLANEGKLQNHQMHEGGFLSSQNSNTTALKMLRPHKVLDVKNGNEHELLKVLEFLAVNVPSFLNPIIVGRPAQDMLEHCINRALWHSSSPSSFYSTSTSTDELLTAVRRATAALAKLYEERSASILSGWPPDEFASADEGRDGSRVIKNGALWECSSPIGEPSLRVGDLPVCWRKESTRVFEKAMEALTLQGVSGTYNTDNDMLQFDGVTSADKQPQIELGSKCRTTDSSTLLALEYKLRANIQDVLDESDLVYSSPFEINWWFEEEEEEKQCEKKIVKERTQENRTAAALLKTPKYQSTAENNNASRIISLDCVSQPPCPSALDASPVIDTTLQLCATTLKKQQAVLRGRLGNALLNHIRSVSRDTQRLAGILQNHITRSSSSSHAAVISGDNLSTISGGGGASPAVVRDVELMKNGIRKERKASENTEKRLQTAVGDWKARRF